jgi:hypothetical protein
MFYLYSDNSLIDGKFLLRCGENVQALWCCQIHIKTGVCSVNCSVSLLFCPVGQIQTVMRVYIGRVGRVVADESPKMNSVDEPNSGYIVHPHRKG